MCIISSEVVAFIAQQLKWSFSIRKKKVFRNFVKIILP